MLVDSHQSSSQCPLEAGLYYIQTATQYQKPNPPTINLTNEPGSYFLCPLEASFYIQLIAQYQPNPPTMHPPPLPGSKSVSFIVAEVSASFPHPESPSAKLATPTPYLSHHYCTPYPGFHNMEHQSVLRPPFPLGAHLTSQHPARLNTQYQESPLGIMPPVPRPKTYYAPPPLLDSINPIKSQSVSIRQTHSHTIIQASETTYNN